MTLVVLLDSGPLGLVTHPRASPENLRCFRWLDDLLQNGARVIVPEIIDYELRRELLRGRKTAGLQRLDALVAALEYEPLTTEIMRAAAEFWARARQQGRPTADDLALDVDMILAAQARAVEDRREAVTVATTNVRHLGLFVTAQEWSTIT